MKFGGGNGHVDNARTNASGRRHIHSRPGILQVQKSTGANVRNGPEFPEHDMISHRLSKRQKHSHYHVVDHSHPGAFSDPGDDGENDFKIVSQREVSVKKPHSQLRNSQRQSQPSFSSSQEKIPPDFFQQTEFNNVESTMYPRPRRSSYKPSNGHHIQGFEARNSSQSFSQGQQQPLAHQAEKLLSVSSSTGPRVPISYDKLDYCGAGQAQESSPSYRSNLRRRYDQRKQRETEPHPVDDDGDDLEVVELPKTSNSPGRRPNARPAGNASMTPSVPIGTAKQEPKSAKQIKQADHDEHYGHGLTEGDIDSANDVDPLQNDDSDFQIKGVAERHRSNEDELLSNNDISATKFTNSQARQNSPQLSNSRSRKRDRGIERSGWQLTYFANLSFEARGDLMLRPSGNKKYEIVIRGHTQEKVKGEPILDTNKLTLFWFNGEAAKLRIRGPRVDSCDYAVDLAFQQTAELRDFAQHLEDSYFIKGHPKDKHVALSRILR